MNRALVLRELTRRGAWSAGVKDEELRLENVHGIVSGRGSMPRTVFGLTAIAAIILIIGLALSKSKKRGRLHPLIVSLIAAVLAGAAGLLVAWLVSDVFMVFGVSLGWPVIFTIAGGIAGVGFVIAAAVTLRGVRRALAVVLVPLVLLSTALGVDSIYGEYQTIGTLVGYTPYASLGSIEVHKAAMSVSDWHSKAQKGSLPSMPSQQGAHRRHSEHRIQLHGPQGDDLPAARRAVRPSAGLAGDGAVGRAAR